MVAGPCGTLSGIFLLEASRNLKSIKRRRSVAAWITIFDENASFAEYTGRAWA